MQNIRLHHYLVYQSPKDAATRLHVDKELFALGCNKLHYSLWRVVENNVKKALEITRDYGPIIFKRTRELTNSQIDFDKQTYDLGSVAIIAYKLPKEQIGKRAARAILLGYW